MKKFITAAAFSAAVILSAAEQTLFKSDFKNNRDMKGWYDFHNSYYHGTPLSKPKAPLRYSKVAEKNGEFILQAGKTPTVLTHPFSKPVLVDDSLKSITMKITLRQTPKSGTTLIEMGLTSRLQPAALHGYGFWKGRDSGVALRGYTTDAHAPNYIYWRKEGGDNKKFRSTRPFNLFPKKILTQWVNCSMTYDHEKKTLSFICEGMEPFIYHNVDLKGVQLNSFFINQNVNEYKSIEVICIKK